jgi:hypothetical protein
MSLSQCLMNRSADLLNAMTQEGTIFQLTQRYDLLLFLWYRKNKNMSGDRTFCTPCSASSMVESLTTFVDSRPFCQFCSISYSIVCAHRANASFNCSRDSDALFQVIIPLRSLSEVNCYSSHYIWNVLPLHSFCLFFLLLVLLSLDERYVRIRFFFIFSESL